MPYETIDTRDLIAELEDNLKDQSELLDRLSDIRENEQNQELVAERSIASYEESYQADLAGLEERAEEIIDIKDQLGAEACRDGLTLISETDFQDLARDYAEDCGAIDDAARWPCHHINWEDAAADLAQDYTTVTYKEQDWLVRQ
jgi:hypothetical protein